MTFTTLHLINIAANSIWCRPARARLTNSRRCVRISSTAASTTICLQLIYFCGALIKLNNVTHPRRGKHIHFWPDFSRRVRFQVFFFLFFFLLFCLNYLSRLPPPFLVADNESVKQLQRPSAWQLSQCVVEEAVLGFFLNFFKNSNKSNTPRVKYLMCKLCI